jgi:hypothetical protein
MTEAMKEKRTKLKELSTEAKILLETGKVCTINEGLKILYTMQGHDKLKTYKQWIEEGYKVKKGEKALLLWAKPLHVQNEEPEPDGAPFFPVINVFSALQVERGLKVC